MVSPVEYERQRESSYPSPENPGHTMISIS
jgi:hypothetical protein